MCCVCVWGGGGGLALGGCRATACGVWGLQPCRGCKLAQAITSWRTASVPAAACVHAVYAVGIYVDHAAAKSVLSSYKRKPASELEADQAFYDGR